jgi:hypothetical protein
VDRFWLWIATKIKNAAIRKTEQEIRPLKGQRDIQKQRTDWSEVIAHQDQILTMGAQMVPVILRVQGPMLEALQEKGYRPSLVCEAALSLKLRSMIDAVTEGLDG